MWRNTLFIQEHNCNVCATLLFFWTLGFETVWLKDYPTWCFTANTTRSWRLPGRLFHTVKYEKWFISHGQSHGNEYKTHCVQCIIHFLIEEGKADFTEAWTILDINCLIIAQNSPQLHHISHWKRQTAHFMLTAAGLLTIYWIYVVLCEYFCFAFLFFYLKNVNDYHMM